MTLEDVIQDLTAIGLYQTMFTGKPNSKVKEIPLDKYPQIINLVNRCVRDIHMRFPINEKEVTIQQDERLAFYKLDRAYAITNKESNEPIKYIIDSKYHPFTNDVGSITAIYDEVGRKLPINDKNRVDSILLKSYNTLMIPYPDNANAIMVMYRAIPENLASNSTDTSVLIDLPDLAREALGTYIIGQLFSSSEDSAKQQLATKYLTSYNNQCQELLNQNVFPMYDDTTEMGLYNRGWE